VSRARFQGALKIAVPVVLLACSLWSQLHYLTNYRQPLVFGDAGAHYDMAKRWWASAEEALTEGYPLRRKAYRRLGRLSYFAASGVLYGGLDALLQGGPEAIYRVHAFLGAATGLLLFLLVYRLTASVGAAAFAQAASIFYVSFTVISGLLLPEPTILFFLTAAAVLLVEARHRDSGLAYALCGLVLGVGLLIRPQSASYLFVLIWGLLFLTAVVAKTKRRAIVAIASGFVVTSLAWGAISWTNQGEAEHISLRYGLWSFAPPYEVGFWVWMDTDGWAGADVKGEYVESYDQAVAADPTLLKDGFRRKLFTIEHVLSRPMDSLRAVIVNMNRFLSLPNNPYKKDYLLSLPVHDAFHRSLVFLAFCFLPVAIYRVREVLPLYVFPICLTFLYPLYHVFGRYNLPMMPFVIAIAACSVHWTGNKLLTSTEDAKRARLPAGIAGACLVAMLLFSPGVSWPLQLDARLILTFRLMLGAGLVFSFLAFFVALARVRGAQKLAFLGTGVLLFGPFAVAEVRDFKWREFGVDLSQKSVVQEIEISDESRRAIRACRESFLLFDMVASGGEVSGLEVEVNQVHYVGDDLFPTMPRFGSATVAGGIEPASVHQWWALPVRPEILKSDTVRIELSWTGSYRDSPYLFGDLPGVASSGVYDGPSFGSHDKVSSYKLRHEQEYRLRERVILNSRNTRSFLDGRAIAGTWRVRLICLDSELGGTRWASAPVTVTEPGPIDLTFKARSGHRGGAELLVCDQAIPFELGHPGPKPFSKAGVSLAVSVEDGREDEIVGSYRLTLPVSCVTPGERVQLELRFLGEMGWLPKHFAPSRPDELPADTISGCEQILKSAPYRGWTVATAY